MSEVTVKNSAIPLAPRAVLATMLASSMLLSGCYSTGAHVPDLTRFPESVPSGLLDFKKVDKSDNAKDEPLPVARRLALSDAGATKLYSFKAMGQSLRVSMMQFAQANKLNVVFDQDVSGVVNVEFHDLTLEQALDSILGSIGLGWVQEDGMIRVTRQVTKTYQVDYLKSSRSGSASASSSSTGSGSSGSNSISSSSSIDFWGDLKTELTTLLAKDSDPLEKPTTENSTTTTNATGTVNVVSRPIQQVVGRVTVDKLTGIVQVTTSPLRMRVVDDFMRNLIKGMNRQVYIEVKILNVALSDDNALGINWSAVANGIGQSYSLGISNTPTSTGVATIPGGTGLTFGGGTSIAGVNGATVTTRPTPHSMLQSITAAITALQQQGTVRVVSEPKVRTLNNQPAIMKVGTDTVSWTATTTASTTTNGVTTNGVTTYAPTVQTIGVLLSVTPQISADGLITMDVMPVVNTLAGTSTSPGGVGAANSTQQILNTQQTSTLVRVKDGETAVVGGLIQLSDSETADNVPGLSNVPVAGALFRGKYSNKVRQELVIFVTPHLIEN